MFKFTYIFHELCSKQMFGVKLVIFLIFQVVFAESHFVYVDYLMK